MIEGVGERQCGIYIKKVLEGSIADKVLFLPFPIVIYILIRMVDYVEEMN